MNVSVVELRYKTKEVLAAVARGERVAIVSRGREKGIIARGERAPSETKSHPFFGSKKRANVKAYMEQLRGGRFRDL